MRQVVKDQLNKITVADLSHFDEKTNTYHIPKYNGFRFEVGGTYIIQIANELINNKNSVIITNWNHGNVLKNKYYKICVSKMAGSMIFIDGLAYDYENRVDLADFWSGWLPIDSIKQIAILNGGSK